MPPAPRAAAINARVDASAKALDEATAIALAAPLAEPLGEECELFDEQTPMHMAWQLDRARQLVAVHCSSGAYNIAHRWFVVEAGEPRALAFPLRAIAASDNGDNWLINAEYDPKTGELNAFNRGRGLGDCGTITQHRWTDQDFELSRLHWMPNCQAVPWSMWLKLVERP